ncbi:MAG: hypothetical protein KDD94_08795 [Calditrichaeota bacterium]|nr:hypothetical protein [Calditrichota bacterium]
MKKIVVRVLISLAVLAILLFGLFLLLLSISETVPEQSNYRINIAEIRRLAGNDSLPVNVTALLIAKADFIKGQVIAAGGFDPYTFHFTTYKIQYEDSSSVIIDPYFSQDVQSLVFPDQPFYSDAYYSMQGEMDNAFLIIATHEHFDHVGGIFTTNHFDQIKSHVRLTREQQAGLLQDGDILEFVGAERINSIHTIDYQTIIKLAPGIVAIKAPGHTIGSQLIYVKLQNGNEYLFLGDIVWSKANIDELTNRSTFSSLLGDENSEQVVNEIRMLYNLQITTSIHLIISHDGEQLNDNLRRGLIDQL